MLALSNIADLRLQQQIAHEIYRQQIMQRLPDPLCGMFASHFAAAAPPQLAAQPSLPGVAAKLENNELWQQFHHIGTEMIITKSGRRMFPSMRVSLSGLEEDTNYCVLLEMVPIGDCRYKFSGSQWVPAGGAEPQSPQRMYLHPDSPATGAHWQSQSLLFSKVKLTNNTLDNNGHIVLASMHKYQPRLHVVRAADLSQLHWAPQQAFVFPETEFIAVTAYQNDRITKLKIDNNPFAKGFRESGQSRCKRKLNDSPPPAPPVGAGAAEELSVSPSAKRLRLAEHHHQASSSSAGNFIVPPHYLLDTLETNCYRTHRIDYASHIASYPNWAFAPPSPDTSCASSSSSSSVVSSASSTLSSCDSDTDIIVDVVGNATTSNAASESESESISQVATAAATAPPKPKRSSFSILDILGKTVSPSS
ncbi:hypothetical protein KR044_004360 [Drosophila immigrans]|nr:hypothetical protein KR044_004360 [Drosophila immigrans]